jgi:DNA-directed RNA polymerase specialized sigma24 family protein
LVLLAKLRSDPIAEPEQVKGYLHQIARNLVIAHFRKVKRHGIHDDGELAGLMAAPQSLPSVQLRGKRIVAKVHRLLGRMKKPRDRAVLLRFFLGRESREQISADMGLSVIQLNKILSRARSRFMEMWYKNGSDQ